MKELRHPRNREAGLLAQLQFPDMLLGQVEETSARIRSLAPGAIDAGVGIVQRMRDGDTITVVLDRGGTDVLTSPDSAPISQLILSSARSVKSYWFSTGIRRGLPAVGSGSGFSAISSRVRIGCRR